MNKTTVWQSLAPVDNVTLEIKLISFPEKHLHLLPGPSKTEWYCGYVSFPNGCPLFEQSSISPEGKPEEGYFSDTVSSIDVHGRVTLAEMEEEGYIYGFDCNHYGDSSKDSPTNNLNWVIEETWKLYRGLITAIAGEKE